VGNGGFIRVGPWNSSLGLEAMRPWDLTMRNADGDTPSHFNGRRLCNGRSENNMDIWMMQGGYLHFRKPGNLLILTGESMALTPVNDI